MLHVPGLYIAHSKGRGRGVFTAHGIAVDDIVEISPVIIIPKKQVSKIHTTVLHDYYFIWDKNEGSACIALGYAMIYNHSSKPNAEIISNLDDETMTLKCISNIDAGDEIVIDYFGEHKKVSEVWFDEV